MVRDVIRIDRVSAEEFIALQVRGLTLSKSRSTDEHHYRCEELFHATLDNQNPNRFQRMDHSCPAAAHAWLTAIPSCASTDELHSPVQPFWRRLHMRRRATNRKIRRPKNRLGLPDLDQSKAAVIGSLRSPEYLE